VQSTESFHLDPVKQLSGSRPSTKNRRLGTKFLCISHTRDRVNSSAGPSQLSRAKTMRPSLSSQVRSNSRESCPSLGDAVWGLAQGPRPGSVRNPDCLAPDCCATYNWAEFLHRVESESIFKRWKHQTCHATYEAGFSGPAGLIYCRRPWQDSREITSGEATTAQMAMAPRGTGSGAITRIRELGEPEVGAPPRAICGDIFSHRPANVILSCFHLACTAGWAVMLRSVNLTTTPEVDGRRKPIGWRGAWAAAPGETGLSLLTFLYSLYAMRVNRPGPEKIGGERRGCLLVT